MKLISATPSPYARKVRICLAEKGIPCELVTEVPWNSTTQTPKYNPLEKLPVLIVAPGEAGNDEEVAVYESHFIIDWLEAKFGAPKYPAMLSSDLDERLTAQQVQVVADGICDALVIRFFERMRPEDEQSKEWVARQMRKVDGGMKWLAGKVASGERYMVAGRFGVADIATGAVCGYLDVRFAEYPWRTTYPALASYIDGLNARQSFAETIPSPQKITDKVV
ncbi:hypothetical protein FH972_022671 [Carpinus fangiana]|uniref:Glutathione S-transferase n=1 Tax=Carpinus fangiana TaxID=176857 RepID=A0A5N6KSX7_9ROSI|nr:hypothetical protein FH972_022671 [Carpinus fangiana]